MKMSTLRLRHLHRPGLTHYEQASIIQEFFVIDHLNNRLKTRWKSGMPSTLRRSDLRPKSPQLLTFETRPTYTCGRREIGRLTEEQIKHLRADGHAEFYEAQRGGQTTYHGPGQLTAYLICTLQMHNLNTRRFVQLLEQSIINVCKTYGIVGKRTKDPGVWTEKGDKIASVGVHVRRYVTSHGIALNLSPDLKWFDRIIACGLPEKRATSFEREGVPNAEIIKVAKVYAQCVANLLDNVDGVKEIPEPQEIGTHDGQVSKL